MGIAANERSRHDRRIDRLQFSRPKAFHNPLLISVLVRCRRSGRGGNFLKGSCRDAVDSVAGFKMAADLILSSALIRTWLRIAGADHVRSKNCESVRWCGIDQGITKNAIIGRIRHGERSCRAPSAAFKFSSSSCSQEY